MYLAALMPFLVNSEVVLASEQLVLVHLISYLIRK